jgi:hypothetical protein
MIAFSHQSAMARQASLTDYWIREPEVYDYDTEDCTNLEIEGKVS